MNLSLIGSWIQTIALPWLTLNLTNDAFKVSLVAVAQFFPPLILTLFSGALLDRFDKKLLLTLSQYGMMLIAIAFTIMVFSAREDFELILIFSFLHGIFTSIDAPARHSLVYDLIDDRDNLANAIALNSMSFNAARILGPSVAGVVMAILGVGYCFLINAISFFAIIFSLKFVKINASNSQNNGKNSSLFDSIKKGLFYVKSKKILIEMLLILLIIATFIPNYSVTISAYAKFVLGGGERTFGYLMSSLGIGAFVGAFFIAARGKMSVKFIYITAIFTSILLMLMSVASSVYMLAFVLVITGFGFVVTTASTNSTIQLATQNEFRGRVMSIYALIFQGSTPFGAIFSGFFTDKFGARFGLFISGFVAFLLFICLIRFIYRNKKDDKTSANSNEI